MTKNNTNEMFANFPDVVDVSGLRTMLGGIGEQKAYELVRKGTIKAIKIGKLYRIPKINVIAFLTQNSSAYNSWHKIKDFDNYLTV